MGDITLQRTTNATELLEWYKKPFIQSQQLGEEATSEEQFNNKEHIHLRFSRDDVLLGFVSYREIAPRVADGHVALITPRPSTVKCLQLSFSYMRGLGYDAIVAAYPEDNHALGSLLDELGFFPCDGVLNDPVKGRIHKALWVS